MDIKLLFTLLHYRRAPNYFKSLILGLKEGLLSYKSEFTGMLSLPEGVELYKLAKTLPQNATVVEIGCYGGLSAAFLLSGLSNRGGKLTSIDPFDSSIIRQKKFISKISEKEYKKIEISFLKNKPSKSEVEKKLKSKGFQNFTLIKDFSFSAVKSWDKKIDLLWIDGNHEYSAVKKDFLDWSPFLKKGAVIAFHDANKKKESAYWSWGWEGPTKVVRKYLKKPRWINIRIVDSLVHAKRNIR